MTKLKTTTVAEQVFQVEGFNVRFLPRTPEAGQRYVDEYGYERAAASTWNVRRWRVTRFDPAYPDFGVEVLDGAGKPVHGKTLLANLRATYEVEPTANPASAKPVAASPQGVARSAVPSATSEPVITSTLETATGGLTLAELESRLWAAANSLRGPVDPADFKSYVFPLLFFKWVSDTWDLDHAAAVADYGTDIPPQAEADYHRFKVPEGCHWSDLQKVSINVGVALQNILDRLAEANPANLAGIFGDVAWGNKERLPEPSLLNLIDSFDRMKLNREVMPNDMLGAAYEYLLRQFADASGQKAGEFFTPRAVVRLLIRILQPQPGEAVYDPACGSGGMLVETINEVAEAGGDTRTLRLYGQEINLTTAAIARMNLFLHDLEDFRIVRGDTLRDPRFLDRSGLRKYDIVVANPPFSQKNWGADTWAQDPYGRASCGVPPAGAADLAWVQHMVGSMRSDTGRVGVVMPHGVLSRGGVEKAIRQCLIEQDMLEAVIGLPPNLFYSTQIRACLLIFQAGKTDARKGSVLFVDGSSCFEKGRNQNQLRSQDIDTIVAAYRDGTSGAKTVAGRLVQHHEVKENGWDLNIGRYLITEAIEGMTVETALNQLAKAQAALQEANDRLSECLRAAGYA